MYEMSSEELAIQKVVWDIEKLGASIDLTDCSILLIKAKDKLSDFIDKNIDKEIKTKPVLIENDYNKERDFQGEIYCMKEQLHYPSYKDVFNASYDIGRSSIKGLNKDKLIAFLKSRTYGGALSEMIFNGEFDL